MYGLKGHPIAPNPFQTVGTFLLSDGVSSDGYSVQALRAKASALFSAAYQLSLLTQNGEHPFCPFAAFGFLTMSLLKGADTYQREERDSLERSITRFISTLVPIHQLESTTLADERQRLLVTHSLAHAAIIHLSRNSAHSDAVAYDKCGRAARAIVRVTEHIGEGDLKYLDPIIGVSLHAFSFSFVPFTNVKICLVDMLGDGGGDVKSRTDQCAINVADV